MTKKKQNKNPEEYSKKEKEYASYIIGNEMNNCSEKIWEVLMQYSFSPSQMYGILESIKLSISNDVYMQASENINACNGCKETIEEQKKPNSKKEKEVQASMYG